MILLLKLLESSDESILIELVGQPSIEIVEDDVKCLGILSVYSELYDEYILF